jgi:hypothetical protein
MADTNARQTTSLVQDHPTHENLSRRNIRNQGLLMTAQSKDGRHEEDAIGSTMSSFFATKESINDREITIFTFAVLRHSSVKLPRLLAQEW